MIVKKEPYEGMDLVEVGMAILDRKLLEIPSSCPPELAYLMKDCWVAVPEQRPTFESIFNRLSYLYDLLVQQK
jgi:hypothetical protein